MVEELTLVEDNRNGRTWPKSRREGWTYFIQATGYGWPVKIGKANNIGERFRSLQGGSFVGLRFLGALPYEEIPERELHRVFAAEHVRGEWFRPHSAIIGLADLGHRHFSDCYRAPQGRHHCIVRDLGFRLTSSALSARDIVKSLALA